jgi:glycosyltransferase involved in cell wall biosynthesis
MSPRRLAIVVSHPIQYYSPWFRDLAAQSDLRIKVFYLWDFGVTEKRDPTFGTSFKWDVPLMEGYESTFVPNVAKDPGTHHFNGLDNPRLNDALLDWNPDAILLIGYNYKSHLRLIFSPRLRRIPILFRGDSHELCPSTGWKPRLSRFLRSLIFRRFDRVLAVGSASVDYFRSSGVPMERIRIIPHCVDNDRFRNAATEAVMEAGQWKQELGIPDGTTIILFAGTLENKKRPQDLLEAFLKILTEGSRESRGEGRATGDEKCSTSVLLFVGSGHLENDLRRMAGDRVGRDVFFAPFQNQLAMPKVYAAGDILVLPSLGRSETWGLAVNEAMNLARPAIVSSHVGCGPDLIETGVTGWVFRAGDAGDLENCLHQALSDPARLKRMGLAARDKVNGFSYEVATKGVVKAVREIGGIPQGGRGSGIGNG